MARRDKFYQIVCDALEAEGWTITHEEYVFDADPQLSTDLGAERLLAAERQLEKIAVEIKSFLQDSQVAELEKAIGQYASIVNSWNRRSRTANCISLCHAMPMKTSLPAKWEN